MTSFTMVFPTANAFVTPPSATGRTMRERIEYLHSNTAASPSTLFMVVIPELNDTFPEDYSDSNTNTNQDRFAPPIGGDDYFPAMEDFELADMPVPPSDDYYDGGGYNNNNNYAKKEPEVFANPFPFPEPEFAYTEETSYKTAAMTRRNNLATPFSVPGTENNSNNNSNAKSNSNDASNESIGKQAIGKNPEEILNSRPPVVAKHNVTSSMATPDLVPKSSANSDIGKRTMTTQAKPPLEETSNLDENQASQQQQEDEIVDPFSFLQQDVQQPEQQEKPPVTMDDADQATFAHFSSIMEDPGPMKPLKAPLQLNKVKPKEPSEALDTGPPPSTAVPSIETNGLDDLVDSLKGQLKSVEQEIETMAPPRDSKTPINLNSHKQVSELLFGRPDMSTNKSTLDGMAGSNILAKLILEYRDIKRRLNKVVKQQELRTASENEAALSPDSLPPRAMKDPVLLFDTSSFIFRAYYSNPPIHRGRDGMPIGAVMGFCSMLNKLLLTSMLRGETPILVQCLDAPGPSFRKHMYPEYKAQRPPIPLDLVPQFDLINKAAQAYGMIQIQADGFEADDVIATLATIGSQEEGLDVKILSGDKDLMQLITEDENDSDSDNDVGEEISRTGIVHMVDPMTTKTWTHDTVIEKWGVKASQLGDVLALAGDTADNIPGVPGIGPKIAAQLLQEFGTLGALLENTDQIPQPKRREKLETNADLALISRELVELKRSVKWSEMQVYYPPSLGETGDYDAGSATTPVALSDSTRIGDLRMQPIQANRILAFYDEMGFHRLKTQLQDRLVRANSRDTSGEAKTNSFSESKNSTTVESKTEKSKAKESKTKKSNKRTFWEKKTRGIPKPEEYKDVPF